MQKQYCCFTHHSAEDFTERECPARLFPGCKCRVELDDNPLRGLGTGRQLAKHIVTKHGGGVHTLSHGLENIFLSIPQYPSFYFNSLYLMKLHFIPLDPDPRTRINADPDHW